MYIQEINILSLKKNPARLLLVDDDRDVLVAASLLLKQYFASVTTESNPEKLPQLLKNSSYDVIVLDMNFKSPIHTGNEGFYWLKEILKICPTAVVILFTAYGGVEMAVRALKEGAKDFVLKPWQNEKFISTISAAAELSVTRQKVEVLEATQKQLIQDAVEPSYDIIGESPAMKEVLKTISKIAQTDAHVLVVGENGTGKDLVARAIHRQSFRSDHVFVNVDLGAIPETLFESELFGHKKGAFTDAKEDRKGRFEVANGGTLFLDEIANTTPAMQAKIL